MILYRLIRHKSVADRIKEILEFEMYNARTKGWKHLPIVTSLKERAKNDADLMKQLNEETKRNFIPYSEKSPPKRSSTKNYVRKLSTVNFLKENKVEGKMKLDNIKKYRKASLMNVNNFKSFQNRIQIQNLSSRNLNKESASFYNNPGFKMGKFSKRPRAKSTKKNDITIKNFDKKVEELFREEKNKDDDCNKIILKLNKKAK